MKRPCHRARERQGTHPLFGRRPPLAFAFGLALDPRLARGGGSEGVGTRGVSLKRSSTLASGGSNTGQVGGRLKIETQGYAAKRRETVPSVGTPLGPRSFLAVFRTQRTASKFLKTLAHPRGVSSNDVFAVIATRETVLKSIGYTANDEGRNAREVRA